MLRPYYMYMLRPYKITDDHANGTNIRQNRSWFITCNHPFLQIRDYQANQRNPRHIGPACLATQLL